MCFDNKTRELQMNSEPTKNINEVIRFPQIGGMFLLEPKSKHTRVACDAENRTFTISCHRVTLSTQLLTFRFPTLFS